MVAIGAIQGAGHRSPLLDQEVTAAGVVTARDTNGFYLQDGGDGDRATSDGIFVFTRSEPTVAVGDRIEVTGMVGEFTPGGTETGNLSTTQLASPSITVIESGAALPAAVVLGLAGRTPPTEVIEDDNFAAFQPARDGIDFYESLEGQRVTVNDPLVIGATNDFGEVWTLADRGAGATSRTAEGGSLLRPDDANPERIQIDDDSGVLQGFASPQVDVRDRLSDVTGVVGYDFGNFQVVPTARYGVSDGGLRKEGSALVGTTSELTVASYNVENLDPSDDEQLLRLGDEVVSRLNGPDVLALQEIQDNSGAADDGVVAADRTLQALADAIAAAGGPAYAFAEIPPVDGTSGGQPGGNIRPAFLYNPDRVDLIDGSLTQVDPSDDAWTDSRIPLVGTFEFAGETVTVINNHLVSKGGSDPLFGARQDDSLGQPADAGLPQREDQAATLNAYVDGLLADDPGANILVGGDLNDFEFSTTLDILKGGEDEVLRNLDELLPANERYDYEFEGNSQTLDHLLASRSLDGLAAFDIIHINAEFADQTSDHDPLLASLRLGPNVIVGTDRGETLSGTPGRDEIAARGGADRVIARAGDDLVAAGSGDDSVVGQRGADILFGDAGADDLAGNDGDDALAGNAGGDTLSGDNGGDRILPGSGNDAVDGGQGRDTAVFAGDRDGYAVQDRGENVLVRDIDASDGATGADRLRGMELAEFDDATLDLATGEVEVRRAAGADDFLI